MRAWFTGEAPAARAGMAATAAELASIRRRVAELAQVRTAARRRAAAAEQAAIAYERAGRTAAALDEVRKRRAHEAEARNAGALADALAAQLAAIDRTALVTGTASSMRAGAAVMTSMRASLDTTGLDEALLDMRVSVRETDALERALTRPLGGGADEDAEDEADTEEHAALRAELAALTAASALEAAPAVPGGAATAPPGGGAVHVAALPVPARGRSLHEVEKALGL